jgi:predicted ribosomally synthesized peptide with SipW-like signal peptide
MVASLALIAGGAYALFSDQDNVNGNSTAVGTISLDAREVANKPMSVTNLLPGEAGDPGTVDLYNDGSREQYQYMHVENLIGDLCPSINLKVGYSFVDPNDFDVTFGTFNLHDLVGPANRIEVGRSHPVGANITTRLVQQSSVDVEAGNGLQGLTCVWDEVFTAEQPTL